MGYQSRLYSHLKSMTKNTVEREIRPIAYGIAILPDDKVWFSPYDNRRKYKANTPLLPHTFFGLFQYVCPEVFWGFYNGVPIDYWLEIFEVCH
jgi:hypothetical protein